MLSALAFIVLSTLQCTVSGAYASYDTQQSMQLDRVKVPVILGVMSACPDALVCESVFDRVLKKVADKTDLALTYIAQSASPSSFPPAPAKLIFQRSGGQRERIRARLRRDMQARPARMRGERAAALRREVPRPAAVVAVCAVPELPGQGEDRGPRRRAPVRAGGRHRLGRERRGCVCGD